jgi:hypothetical protein
MPSVSKAQQRFMGMELAKQRKTGSNATGMSAQQLSEFAATPTKGLPKHKPVKFKKGMKRKYG